MPALQKLSVCTMEFQAKYPLEADKIGRLNNNAQLKQHLGTSSNAHPLRIVHELRGG